MQGFILYDQRESLMQRSDNGDDDDEEDGDEDDVG
jgi:hypothetical protein